MGVIKQIETWEDIFIHRYELYYNVSPIIITIRDFRYSTISTYILDIDEYFNCWGVIQRVKYL